MSLFRPRFSLKALLVCVFLISVALGFYAYQRNQRQKELIAVKKFEDLGAIVVSLTKKDSDYKRYVCIEFGEIWKGKDSDFKELLKLADLRIILLKHPSIGQEALAHIVELPKLKEIQVSQTANTKSSIAFLRNHLPQVDVERELK